MKELISIEVIESVDGFSIYKLLHRGWEGCVKSADWNQPCLFLGKGKNNGAGYFFHWKMMNAVLDHEREKFILIENNSGINFFNYLLQS